MKLKVVCLNLWFGGVLMKDVLAFLAEEDADVVMLQEVFDSGDPKLPNHYRSLETLQAHLHYPYEDFAPAVLDKFPWGSVKNGNAVLSRLPIKDRDVTFFDHEYDEQNPRSPFDPAYYPVTPRNVEHVTLETLAGDINVYNLQGVYDLDGDNVSSQRKKMVETILAKTKNKPNVIIAGDTNAKHTNPVMKDIETHFTNIFGNTLTTSFNVNRKDNPGYASAVVDMIYTSPSIKVLNKSCPAIDISDHLPLVVTLEIPKPH